MHISEYDSDDDVIDQMEFDIAQQTAGGAIADQSNSNCNATANVNSRNPYPLADEVIGMSDDDDEDL